MFHYSRSPASPFHNSSIARGNFSGEINPHSPNITERLTTHLNENIPKKYTPHNNENGIILNINATNAVVIRVEVSLFQSFMIYRFKQNSFLTYASLLGYTFYL